MKDFPFKQVKLRENIVRRTFSVDVDPSELVWHMDREDRVVKVLEGASWCLQMDNELPTKLIEGKEKLKTTPISKLDKNIFPEYLYTYPQLTIDK